MMRNLNIANYCLALRFSFVAVLALLMLEPVRANAVTTEVENRHALVIGNSDYTLGPLDNPANDAADMSAALRYLGFEVTTLLNADFRQMRRAAIEFGRNLENGGVGLFYYAGHGMQVNGENYLIPLGAVIEHEDHVPIEAMSVNQVLGRMSGAKNRMNIVILDACRNNPLKRSVRSASSGLAQMDAPTGTYIAYATAPGQTAADGNGRNGLYTSSLLKALKKPGLELEATFKSVRKEVVMATDGEQVPWSSSSVIGDFMFLEEPDEAELVFEEEGTQVSSTAPSSLNREKLLWEAIQAGQQSVDYETFLTEFPNGVYAGLARARLQRIKEAEADQKQSMQEEDQRGLALVQKQQDELAALKAKQQQLLDQLATQQTAQTKPATKQVQKTEDANKLASLSPGKISGFPAGSDIIRGRYTKKDSGFLRADQEASGYIKNGRGKIIADDIVITINRIDETTIGFQGFDNSSRSYAFGGKFKLKDGVWTGSKKMNVWDSLIVMQWNFVLNEKQQQVQ